MSGRLSSLGAVLAAATLLPAARAADTGAITGTVDKPAAVAKVTAVDRAADKRYPGLIDAKTGAYTIADLPLGATYDVVIDAGAARLEGVNLKVPHSDYEEEQPLTKDDVKTLTQSAKDLNKFEDNVEVLTITGNIQHAAVLMNKTRTTPFVNSQPGEMIWRLELWHFERPDDTWVKVQDELFVVLYRERLQKTDFAKKSLTLDPALGAVKLTEKRPKADLGKVQLPSNDPGVRLRAGDAKDK
jgi:hypothetical protein